MTALTPLRDAFSQATDALFPPAKVHAHCDIPCGIYDPHEAQIASLTVWRMDQLLQDLKAPAMDTKPEERAAYVSQTARYTAIKELHAEKVKHEVRVIFGDYFTDDLLKAHPQAQALVWKIYKAASKARQSTAVAAAEDLHNSVQEFAELFWKTKSVATTRLPSHQKANGTLVVPTA